ncbi:MFS transporter [Quadrisphaera sp. DSM 44207]|uniref:MFS transporter n=1 Tax=Quadrisphaera sp. DSM 44207 TaxID=1881057 RepID=UPI00088EB944|nr:MFS transporter [Quadrisphaera sp. DSM 44207]SDQ47110.1 Major Facilitator Superfamily protein [Quadrisphaera sp. DSM 44207]
MTSSPATDRSTAPSAPARATGWRHPAWLVAAVAFVALVGAAGFRAAPGVLMVPLEAEFGWPRSVLSAAVGVNLVLFGLTAPFAAALMDRFGIRRVTACALLLVALGSGGAVLMSARWHLFVLWGVLVGLGTGSMALVFAATVAQRWFVARRGLVMGVLTAGSATGQLVFLPVAAWLVEASGWRAASLVIAGAALAVVPLVVLVLRDRPADVGARPYGDDGTAGGAAGGAAGAGSTPAPETVPHAAGQRAPGPAGTALDALRGAARTRAFWALAVGFAICGASTNGLVATHLVPAAHDHGMAATTAAGLLAVVGVFDVVGTIASGWLTDRFDPRVLLGAYYLLRGASLFVLPSLLDDALHPSVLVFVVVYGLDWVATVPPTVALCRELFGERGTVVFGWVFAAHQLGAAAAASAAGAVRDATGAYTLAWVGAGALCGVAAVLSLRVARSTPAAA